MKLLVLSTLVAGAAALAFKKPTGTRSPFGGTKNPVKAASSIAKKNVNKAVSSVAKKNPIGSAAKSNPFGGSAAGAKKNIASAVKKSPFGGSAAGGIKKNPIKAAVGRSPLKSVANVSQRNPPRQAAGPIKQAKQAIKKTSIPQPSTFGESKFQNDIGALLPLGFWDPLGLVSDGDEAKFERLRNVELKHGRISMLAVVGYLVQEAGFRWPGAINLSGLKYADIPNGYAAFETIPYAGNLQILAFIGFLEVFVMRDFVGGEFPGDLRNNYIDFGWDTFDESTKLRKRTIELNQGRAAMMGILGLMVHEQLGVSIIPSVAEPEYVF